LVTDTLVEGNAIKFELSSSHEIAFVRNESRDNTIGMALLLLPHLFEDRPGAKQLTVSGNFIHDNNRANDAPPGSLLSSLPRGIGVLLLGVDDTVVSRNRIQANYSVGLAVVDVCLALPGTRFDCSVNPRVTPAVRADQQATNNAIVDNVLLQNGIAPPSSPFAFAASDLALLSLEPVTKP
jgi:hypothetical protein